MFTTLRSRLIASYVLIVFLCLMLAGLTTMVLMRQYQERVELARLRNVATDLSRRLPAILNRLTDTRDILLYMRQEALALRLRVMVVDAQGLVQYDTTADGNLVGQQVLPPQQKVPSPDGESIVRRHQTPDGLEFFLVLTPLPPFEGQRMLSGEPPYLLALAAPFRQIRPPWRDMLPPLFVSALLALIVSAIAAFFLSRSITRPLSAMTQAAEEIAHGNYRQSIPVRGEDQIARLAASFNHMAREVERARQTQRDFIANVSHDLKTPLTSIQGFSQAILEGAVTSSEGYHRAAEIIHQESERMGRLVSGLLELARLEAGQADMARKPVDLQALLSSYAARLEPRFEAAGIRLHQEISPLPMVEGDEHRLEEVIANLLDNAVSYTDRGGEVHITAGSVEVRSGHATAPGGQEWPLPPGMTLEDRNWVLVSVSDTGVGIPPEDLPRIFERFYRADKSRGCSKGSGLGLAIAREIIAAHGGHIGVESEAGVGTRFVVALPVLERNNK